MTDYVVEGLSKRRAEIAGEMSACQARMAELARDLETLDAALRLVAPDLDIPAIAPKVFRPPSDWSKRGEMSRTILEILRVSRDPMTSREIAAEMIVRKGVNATPQLLKTMSKRVSCCLRDRREQGLVRALTGTGYWHQWELVR